MHLAANHRLHSIKMPFPVLEPAHPRHALHADIGCKHRTKPVSPAKQRSIARGMARTEPNCRVNDVDPVFKQQILDVPQRQREPNILHHHKVDRLG
jgi:hypothetical protein